MSAQLADLAPSEGANVGSFPGLVTYRFSSPTAWSRGPVSNLTLVMVVQGRHDLTVNWQTHRQGYAQCLVLGAHVHVDSRVVQASFDRPYLSLVVDLAPGAVRRMASEMLELRDAEPQADQRPARLSRPRHVYELFETVIRAERSITSDMDRHLLAPLYRQEIAYKVLQSEQGHQWRAPPVDPVHDGLSPVIEYAESHFAEPLTVPEMADMANLSTSVFARRFRDVTGLPPHQYLKAMRLYHARQLLTDGGLSVAQVSHEVGYASVSQFINAFRNRYGATPRVHRTTP